MAFQSGTNFAAPDDRTTGLKVVLVDDQQRPLFCYGATVPTSGVFAKGCIFMKTDAATGVKALYENQGTTTSVSFNVIGSIAEAEIALADGKVLVGAATGLAAAQTMSGDITMTNAAVTTIGAAKVTAAKTAIADTKVLIGGATGVAAEFALSGDVTMTNAGVTAIGTGKVLVGMIGTAAVTTSKISFASKAVTVTAGAASGASGADAALVGATIVGVLPTGNQDQFMDNIAIAGDGAITVTLAANATANNTFSVVLVKAA